MAHDAGYSGKEARQVVQMLEQQHYLDYMRHLEEQAALDELRAREKDAERKKSRARPGQGAGRGSPDRDW